MTHTNSSVALFNTETDIIDANKIQEITLDFSKQMDELDKAIQLTKNAGELASAVKEKGIFGTFIGSLSGSNDKQLAESVKILGASVEITQKIIEVILKVSNAKNQFLRSFHTALTTKILTLNNEMDVTHGNQKNAKSAIITIATQLRDQIEEKISHSEMIDEHEELIEIQGGLLEVHGEIIVEHKDKIIFLEELSKTKEILDKDQSAAIIELKEDALKKDSLDNQQSKAIDLIKDIVALNEDIDLQQTNDIKTLKVLASAKEKLDNEQSNEIQKLKELFSKLNSVYENQAKEIQILKDNGIEKYRSIDMHAKEINLLADKIDKQQKLIELTNVKFDTYISECNSLAYKVKASVLPIVSILIAVTAVYLGMK